jgi:uncharacterized protein YcfJ
MRTLRRLRHLPAALALAAAAACTPLPDYRTPEPVPAPSPLPDRLEAVARGERVLVDHATLGGKVERLAGRAVQVDSLGITVRTERETRRVERAALRDVWVIRGRKSRRGSAAVGFVAGLVIGGVAGYAAGDDCGSDDFICIDRSETAPIFALLGAALGAGVGAIAGGGEKWVRVPLGR